MAVITGVLLPSAVLLAHLAAGVALAERWLPGLRRLESLCLGGVLGLLGLTWLPCVFAFFLGFSLPAHLLALALGVAGTAVMLTKLPRPACGQRVPQDRVVVAVLIPFLLLCAYLLYTHTLQNRDGALYTGQSTFGDMSMHLGFITSLFQQKSFPPEYSIFPGTAVGYPFLCDSISSTLMVFGAGLTTAYVLPAIVALALVFVGLYLFFEQLLGKPRYAFLALALFLLCGGFGFAYFFDNVEQNTLLSSLFTGFYTTPTNLVDQNIRWVNVICDMLIPQRATLFGWMVCFPALYLLMRLYDRGERRVAVMLGVLGGLLPLVHTHSFLALGMISLVTALLYAGEHGLARAFKVFWPYALLALVLALPQLVLFTFRQSAADNFLRLGFNWGNRYDNYIWFYLKNVGVVALLLIPAVLHAPRRVRKLSLGALVLFVISELVLFQPNAYDNNKLIYISYAFACGMTAQFMVDAYGALKAVKGRQVLACITLGACFTSAVLTIGREINSSYLLFPADHVEAAKWIEENTDEHALFLTAQNHNNTVAALTGRSIVLGTDSYLYFHGFDTGERKEQVRRMFEEQGYLREGDGPFDVDYIFVSEYERRAFDLEQGALDDCTPVYENASVVIYAVEPNL